MDFKSLRGQQNSKVSGAETKSTMDWGGYHYGVVSKIRGSGAKSRGI